MPTILISDQIDFWTKYYRNESVYVLKGVSSLRRHNNVNVYAANNRLQKVGSKIDRTKNEIDKLTVMVRDLNSPPSVIEGKVESVRI